MKTMSMMPIMGIKTEGDDTRLIVKTAQSQEVFVRDLVDMDVERGGAFSLRHSPRKVCNLPLTNLWQSPLHGDLFATHGETWGRVTKNWELEPLAVVGAGECWPLVLNNKVALAAPYGLFEYDGQTARRLTLDTPAPPMLTPQPGAGSLVPGAYTVALAYLRGGMESALSDLVTVKVGEGCALEVTLPMVFDTTVDKVRIYLSKPDGGALGLAGDYAVAGHSVTFPTLPALGIAPRFQHMEAMPTGKYLALWQGRLLTAKRNVLHFSEPLAYHINDPRHGFIQMPQRITFLAPVEEGIWVGQVDHVDFLRGLRPSEMVAQRRAAQPPVPGSAILIPSEMTGDASNGGRHVAVWLSANGHVMGTPSGETIETGAGKLSGIFGNTGQTVHAGDRLHTLTL